MQNTYFHTLLIMQCTYSCGLLENSKCLISNTPHWHLLKVKACVKGTIVFQKEYLVFVL